MKTKNIFLIAFALLAVLLTSCETEINFIEGSGHIVSRTLDIDEFNKLSLLGADNVVISYAEVQEVLVSGDDNIIDRIKTDVMNGTWFVDLERGSYRNYDLKYYISLPRINEISCDGASKVVVNNFINEGDLTIDITGTSYIELNRMENTENLFISIDGLGHIKAYGEFPSLQYLDIFISGSGEYLGYPVLAQECRVEINGAAKCEVAVENQLDVTIDGAGLVRYRGNPDISQHISGMGIVKQD